MYYIKKKKLENALKYIYMLIFCFSETSSTNGPVYQQCWLKMIL
jgi:hypothetical protein